jgi:hypothetical protein
VADSGGFDLVSGFAFFVEVEIGDGWMAGWLEGLMVDG